MNSGTPPRLLLHLRPADPELMCDQIARQICSCIVRGELAAGQPLPGHRQIARQHRIAPFTVEAAYGLLVVDGLLTGLSGDEVRVAHLEPERRRELVERLQLENLVEQELGRRELGMARDGRRRLLPPELSELGAGGVEVSRQE